MSYSFGFTATTKEDAKRRATAGMATAVAQQPSHARDFQAAVGAAHGLIDALDVGPGQDVSVSMSGYLTGMWNGADMSQVTGGQISVSVNVIG